MQWKLHIMYALIPIQQVKALKKSNTIYNTAPYQPPLFVKKSIFFLLKEELFCLLTLFYSRCLIRTMYVFTVFAFDKWMILYKDESRIKRKSVRLTTINPTLFSMPLLSATAGAFRGHTRKPQPSLARGSLRLTLCAF